MLDNLRLKRDEAQYWIKHFEEKKDKESERYWVGYKRGLEFAISELSQQGYE